MKSYRLFMMLAPNIGFVNKISL